MKRLYLHYGMHKTGSTSVPIHGWSITMPFARFSAREAFTCPTMRDAGNVVPAFLGAIGVDPADSPPWGQVWANRTGG